MENVIDKIKIAYNGLKNNSSSPNIDNPPGSTYNPQYNASYDPPYNPAYTSPPNPVTNPAYIQHYTPPSNQPIAPLSSPSYNSNCNPTYNPQFNQTNIPPFNHSINPPYNPPQNQTPDPLYNSSYNSCYNPPNNPIYNPLCNLPNNSQNNSFPVPNQFSTTPKNVTLNSIGSGIDRIIHGQYTKKFKTFLKLQAIAFVISTLWTVINFSLTLVAFQNKSSWNYEYYWAFTFFDPLLGVVLLVISYLWHRNYRSKGIGFIPYIIFIYVTCSFYILWLVLCIVNDIILVYYFKILFQTNK